MFVETGPVRLSTPSYFTLELDGELTERVPTPR